MSNLKFVLCATLVTLSFSNRASALIQDADVGQQREQTNQLLFEVRVDPPSVSPGDFVLCPSRQFYENALENGIEKTTFIYYAAKLVKMGEASSTVKNLAGRTYTLPNQLIISIASGQKAKKGDVVLTWWQSGSGMQRAIVIGGTETEPVVRYLDVTLDNPSGVGKKEHTLKPNTFYVLDKRWQVGTTVRVTPEGGRSEKHGLLVAVNDDQIIIREFSGKLNAYARSVATPLPIMPKVNANDAVNAAIYGAFKPVTVKRVDAEIGRVFVNFQLGRKEREIAIAFGDVYKTN